jgi:hypothetical protein
VFLYIDPTSGGLVLQVLLSGFVGAFVFLKVCWRSVLSLIPFRGGGETDPTAEETDEATPVA